MQLNGVSIESAVELLKEESVGLFVMAVGHDGSIHCQQKQLGLVVPMVSTALGASLSPQEIIALIAQLAKLQAKPTRRTASQAKKTPQEKATRRVGKKSDEPDPPPVAVSG